ncbi:hypothetical protein ARMGADRAFT_304556 [Armillaria gallica]|uniref:Uncharacterized protein n=1 Tax=Armillaria gallica TaxID=47427 RepID=A0A2H3D7I3_ARMGA|nr:hypothetical protein ARMGADRAFT_304556 [Armillaria gallica]
MRRAAPGIGWCRRRVQHGPITYYPPLLHAFTTLLEDYSFHRLIHSAYSSTNNRLLHRPLDHGWRSLSLPLTLCERLSRRDAIVTVRARVSQSYILRRMGLSYPNANPVIGTSDTSARYH